MRIIAGEVKWLREVEMDEDAADRGGTMPSTRSAYPSYGTRTSSSIGKCVRFRVTMCATVASADVADGRGRERTSEEDVDPQQRGGREVITMDEPFERVPISRLDASAQGRGGRSWASCDSSRPGYP